MNPKTISKVMAEMGSKTSAKKKASSKLNGHRGGRPIEKNDPASIQRRIRYAQRAQK